MISSSSMTFFALCVLSLTLTVENIVDESVDV